MRICGIDPGTNGAICVLDEVNPAHIALLDLKKTSIYDACLWLEYYDVHAVWLEDVHSMFGMSAKSNFGFGRNLGVVTAISQMATEGMIANTVTPKIWQKHIGVTAKGKAIKKQVAEIAQKLYPTAELYGKRGGLLDGRSDALMIAHYGLHNKEKV
jgi:Holliday junction resolvasome RuvABC endonuclease subunit